LANFILFTEYPYLTFQNKFQHIFSNNLIETVAKSRIQFPPDFIFQTSPGTYSYFYPALYPDYLSDLSSLSAIEK